MLRIKIGSVLLILVMASIACSSATPTSAPATAVSGPSSLQSTSTSQPAGQVTNPPEVTEKPIGTSTPIPTSTNLPPSVGKVGETVSSSGFSLTVIKITKAANVGLSSAKTGNIIVDIEVVIQNTGKDSVPYNPFYFTVKDSDSFEYTTAFGSLDPALKSGDLNPGEMARGHVAFEVPEKATGLIVSYVPLVLFGGYQPVSVNLDEVADQPSVIGTGTVAAINGKIGDKVESAGMALIVVGVQKVQKAGEFATANAGNIIVDLDVVVQNTSRTENVPFNPMYFKVKDSNGYEYNVMMGGFEPTLGSGDLPKGDMVRGHIAFEVLEKDTGLTVSYEPQVIFGGYQTIRIDLDSTTSKPSDLPKPLTYPITAIGTPVESGGISVTVVKVQKLDKIDYFTPGKGNTILDVEVIVQNTNRSDTTPYNPLYFNIKDANGYEYSSAMFSLEPSLKSGDLAKGDKARGHISFEVPADATGLVISYVPTVLFSDYQVIYIGLP